MRYKDGTAFRRALEDRLRFQSIQTGKPLVRLRKLVAFDRFLARMLVVYPVYILLLARQSPINGELLSRSLKATFDFRQTHNLPVSIPSLPKGWDLPFLKFSDEVEIGYSSLDDAREALESFLNPILSGKNLGEWNPKQWWWEERVASSTKGRLLTADR